MESAKLLTALMQQTILGLNTAHVAKVLSFDINKQEATIQPLFQTKEYGQSPKTQAIIEGVPVVRSRYQERIEGGGWSDILEHRAVYKAGDIVLCIVVQRSTDDIDTGVPHYAGKARIYNMQDSVIVGVIA